MALSSLLERTLVLPHLPWFLRPFGDSVLEPLLYIIHTSAISPLLSSCGLRQIYVDDVRVYTQGFSDTLVAVQQLCHVIDTLTGWFASNCFFLTLPRFNLSG